MIHTLAPPKVRELIGEVLVAPVQPWDALICTSPQFVSASRVCLIVGKTILVSALVVRAHPGPSCR